MTPITRRALSRIRRAVLGAAALTSAALLAHPAQAIIVRDDVGLVASRDTANVWPNVVQLFVQANQTVDGYTAGGLYFNCTGTLINYRTILTAAHCVNNNIQGSELWGLNRGLTNLIGVSPNTNPGLGGFLGGADVNHGGWAKGTDVIIHPSSDSTKGGLGFPWTDTALIALNTPVSGAATGQAGLAASGMGMLFSPLTSVAQHVVQAGYGTTGNGSNTIPRTIGFRREVGENMLGILGSDADFIDAIFPTFAPNGFETQLEYYTDFDKPDRTAPNAGCTFSGSGISCADANAVRSIDWFPGNALPREVTTAPGDSGGALIADNLSAYGGFSQALIIGDLSGGWTFFNNIPGYGANGTAFYQPLFSVFQFIMQNNPLKYVSAVAGNGSWDDPTHWVQNLDPNYYVINGGVIVNGVPAGTEKGVYQTTPKLGTVLSTNISGFPTGSPGLPPQNVSTPLPSLTSNVIKPTESPLPFNGAVLDQNGNPVVVTNLPQVVAGAPSGPDPQTPPINFGGNLPTSGALTGPGSTNFVPNNTDGTPGTAFANPARYFDVTLSAAGTTTLGSTKEIDRLTIVNSAVLDIQAAGTLTSNIDVELYNNSRLNVDGVLRTSDLTVVGGVVTGSGVINLGVTTGAVLPTAFQLLTLGSSGALTAGGVGTTGTLTVNGNVLFSSGAMLVSDLSATSSDKLVVNGVLGAGGTFITAPVAGFAPTLATTAIVAQATTITGSFTVPDTVAGVLFPVLTKVTLVGSQQEVLTFQAASFLSLLTNPTADQTTIANALDDARALHYNDLLPLYLAIDPLPSAPLGQALENLAPDAERASTLIGDMVTTGFDGMLWQHMADIGGPAGGQHAGLRIDSDGLKMALNSASAGTAQSQQFMALGASIATNPGGGNDAIPTTGTLAAPHQAEMMALPNGAGGFLSGSSLSGSVAIGGGGGRADVRGFVIGGGLDAPVGEGFTVGGSFGYSDALAVLRSAPSSLQSNSLQGAVYARYDDMAENWIAQAFASYGHQTVQTRRVVVVGGTSFALSGHSGGDSPSLGIYIGKSFVETMRDGATMKVVPSLSLQYLSASIDPFTETGGAPAMSFSGFRGTSLLARLGADVGITLHLFDIIATPNLHGFWVNNFSGNNGAITAAFAAAPSSIMTFAMTRRDHSYFELGAGADFDLGDVLGSQATLSGRYDMNSRTDVRYGAWTGRLSIKF